MDTARYISNHVIDDKRNGRYNSWAKNTMKKHARTIRKLYRIHGINLKIRKNDEQYLKSVIKRMKNQNKTKFGIKIPQNVKEALLFDKFNKNTKWADAIAKEMEALRKLDVFEFLPSNCNFSKEDGWQYAPMHMIFTIKQEDMRYKARFVMNGNVIDASDYVKYSSTVNSLSVRLLFIVAAKEHLDIMTGDVANAFPTAPCQEKV